MSPARRKRSAAFPVISSSRAPPQPPDSARLLLIAALPAYPYSRGWGYLPAGIVTLLLIAFVVLIALDYVALWYPWAPVDIAPAPAGSPIIEPPD